MIEEGLVQREGESIRFRCKRMNGCPSNMRKPSTDNFNFRLFVLSWRVEESESKTMKAIEKVYKSIPFDWYGWHYPRRKSNTSSRCRRRDLPHFVWSGNYLGEKWWILAPFSKTLLWLKNWPPWRSGARCPQLDISKRIIAVLVPNPEDADGNPPKEAYSLQGSHVQSKGCLPILFKMRLWRRGRLSL